MILNGKAREDFEKWVDENDAVYFTNKTMVTHQHAVIIEWLDSVGIYILTILDETNKHKFKYLITDKNIRHLHGWREGTNKETRKEATQQAIESANEIYNTKNK